MAQSEHRAIYKASCDFSLYVEQLVHGFSRYHKYSLGAELREGARWVLRLVVRANGRRDKVPVLLEIRERCEDLKVLLRLGHDAAFWRTRKQAPQPVCVGAAVGHADPWRSRHGTLRVRRGPA